MSWKQPTSSTLLYGVEDTGMAAQCPSANVTEQIGTRAASIKLPHYKNSRRSLWQTPPSPPRFLWCSRHADLKVQFPKSIVFSARLCFRPLEIQGNLGRANRTVRICFILRPVSWPVG
jgi:hypothetical protein